MLVCRASVGPVKIDGLQVPMGQGIVGKPARLFTRTPSSPTHSKPRP